MAKIKLTERFLSRLKPGSEKHWDLEQPGLHVIAYERPVFYCRAGGKDIRIGLVKDWPLQAARDRARDIRGAISKGEEIRPTRADILTVRQAFAKFEEIRLSKRRARTGHEYRRQMEMYVFPRYGDRQIDRITRADIVELHHKITAAGHATRGNRVLATISSLYGWLQKDQGYKGVNPASKIERNIEHGRELFLSPEQVTILRNALAEYAAKTDGRSRYNAIAADCLALIIATGCRAGEARGATWDQLDESLTVWSKAASTTKQRKTHRVPIGPAAQVILLRRRGMRRPGETMVFPSRSGKPIDLRAAWEFARRATGLPEGVRIHDMRHSFASLAVSAGVPLRTIGGLLGHSAIATTNRYAHLFDDDLAAAAGAVHRLIENGKKSSGER